MRVGDASFFRMFLNGMNSRRGDLERAVRSLSDGRRVRYVSDDPAGARESLALRGRVARLEGYRRSSERSRFDLATIDNILGELVNYLTDVRSEAMAGASSVQEDGNDARAAKIDAVREQLLQLANTEQNGRYLFSGTETLTAAFAPDGTYNGNGAQVEAPLDDRETVGTTLDGSAVFQGPSDLFALLEDLSTALRADDADAVNALIPQFTEQLDHVTQLRTDVGERMRTIDAFADRQADEEVRLLERIAEIEEAPFEEVAVQLAAAQTSRDALSATAARILGRSLFDYLG